MSGVSSDLEVLLDRLADLVGVPILPDDRAAVLETLERTHAMAEQVAKFVLTNEDEPVAIFRP